MGDSPISYAQIGTVLFGILIFYEEFKIIKLDRKEWKRVINAVLWGIHLLTFYLVLYLDGIGIIDVHGISKTFFTDWSPYLRLHSAVAFYLVARSAYEFLALNKKFLFLRQKYKEQSEIKNVT
jgi:hypothetical protein